MKTKQLIIMNGRFLTRGKFVHAYVAAYSKADANRLLIEAANGHGNFVNEINTYFSIGCWGNHMDGITVERGVWLQTENDKPIKVV